MTTYKILIADDDTAFLAAMKARLTAEGFDVIAVQDSYQALEIARKRLPDLLALDVNMPAGDGFSVNERIRKISELANTPVIYFTGERSSRVRQGAKSMGASALLYKPFDTEELLSAVRSALGIMPELTNDESWFAN